MRATMPRAGRYGSACGAIEDSKQRYPGSRHVLLNPVHGPSGPLALAALKGLIRIADERAVPGLRRVFLSSGDRRIRDLAGRALARSASRAGLLYPGWWMTPSEIRAIAWVLGEIRDKNSAVQLSRLLTHRDELVRARASAALGKIADQATAPALGTALNDISPHVRASAATALGLLGVTDASQWLRPTLRDP